VRFCSPRDTLEPQSIPRLSDEVVAEICGQEAEWNEVLWERIVVYLVLTEDGKQLLMHLLCLNSAHRDKNADDVEAV
jgi:hypothetical protein